MRKHGLKIDTEARTWRLELSISFCTITWTMFPYLLKQYHRGKWGKTDQRGKTDHRLSGPNQRCCMLEYILATLVLVCPNRAGHMVGLAGPFSELFDKMLFFYKTILCERSVDHKI